VRLRTRLTIAASVAVVVAVALSSVLVYLTTRRQLYEQVDQNLDDRAVTVLRTRPRAAFLRQRSVGELLPPSTAGTMVSTQVLLGDGTVLVPSGSVPLPVSDAALTVAHDGAPSVLETVTVDGDEVRVLTAAWTDGVAVRVARGLGEVDDTLARLRLVLALVTAGAVVLAAGLGFVVSRTALRPVEALTETAERVARTRDLSERIATDSSDELGRLAESFNTMLQALDQSVRAQRALVADASHELRTPLTSLRTNVSLLMRADELDEVERRQLASDVDAQIADLTVLIGDVIELARGGEPAPAVAALRLDEVVTAVVDQASMHWPEVRFDLAAEPTVVSGSEERIARAVTNLVDNAGKWSPPGASVEVSVGAGEVVVRDHGPGVAPADAPHVFDRFWRAPSARGLPGSGLGLAIVKQVADAHGATVAVEEAPGGGARFRLRFPAPPPPPPSPTPSGPPPSSRTP
jgi:two-component system sensor histidine kinase MprB